MKIVVALLTLAALSGCGADGSPIRPTGNVGVSIGPNGISPSVGLGATNGTISVGLGL